MPGKFRFDPCAACCEQVECGFCLDGYGPRRFLLTLPGWAGLCGGQDCDQNLAGPYILEWTSEDTPCEWFYLFDTWCFHNQVGFGITWHAENQWRAGIRLNYSGGTHAWEKIYTGSKPDCRNFNGEEFPLTERQWFDPCDSTGVVARLWAL